MTLLFKIVRGAHANGTHHKLALDALTYLAAPKAEQWRKLFLNNAELYLEGSKAPDKQFKDFRNHVLHVGDNYWGGAPEAALEWYERTIRTLKDEKWSDAVYAAGVLSHYYTDPIQPFHTAQSEAENNVHRAVEWSISKSYDALYELGCKSCDGLEIELDDDEDWLTNLVCRGAERSNTYYEQLISNYDFKRGVVDPPAGLNDIARAQVGELIAYAAMSFAMVLDRAFDDARAEPPDVAITAQTFLASLRIPRKWVTRKMTDAKDRRFVERMYDELAETGRVEVNLPTDDRMVRDLHAKEVLSVKKEALAHERSCRLLAVRQPAQLVRAVLGNAGDPLSPRSLAEASRVMDAALDKPVARSDRNQRCRGARLHAGDDVVDAPSIGPKTAARLEKADIRTLANLLAADPDALAERLDVRHITARAIADWQLQTRLVMDIPGLTGTDAQLLVGAGFPDRQKVADATPAELISAIRKFCESSDGERILRSGKPPDNQRITHWIVLANAAQDSAVA